MTQITSGRLHEFINSVQCGSSLFPNEPYHKVVTIREGNTFGEAFKRLIENRILSLVVVDENQKPVGAIGMLHVISYLLKMFQEDDFGPTFYMKISSLVSDSPYADKATIVTKTKISEIIKGVTVDIDPVYSLPQDAYLGEALVLMLGMKAHRIVVTNKEGHLKSIITQSKIVNLLNCMEVPELHKSISELDAATKDVVTIKESETAYSAFKLMESKRISGLAVVNEEGELVGNISVSDIKLIGWNADYWNLLGLPIKNYLAQLLHHQENIYIRSYNFWTVDRPNTVVLKCRENDDLKSVVNTMNFFKVHRLYVVKDKKPIGIVSMYDVLKAVTFAPAAHQTQ